MTTGTIAQSLPAITQSSEGYQLFNAQLHEVVNAAAFPSEPHEDELSEYALAGDSATIVLTQATSHTANASDELTYDAITSLDAVATASNSFQADDFVNIGATAKIGDTISQWAGVTLVSTVNIVEAFAFVREYDLTTTATATGTIDPGVTYTQLVEAGINASGPIYTGQEVEIEAAINVTDIWTDWAAVLETLTSVANLTEDLVPQALITETLSDSAQGSSSYSFEGSVYSDVLTDVAVVSDWMWAKDFGSIAWVLNTQSGGISNYDNFGFHSVAYHDGKLYATSPEGIFELDADDDAGRKIDSLIKGGFLDFGTEQKKRISDIFVGYTGGDLECEVETYDKQAYTYPMEYREADTPRNSRIKPGRGLSSSWWRFTFRNVNGADFQIHDIAVQVAKSNRRL